eukprot:696001-Rhodomonas_salina.1
MTLRQAAALQPESSSSITPEDFPNFYTASRYPPGSGLGHVKLEFGWSRLQEIHSGWPHYALACVFWGKKKPAREKNLRMILRDRGTTRRRQSHCAG